MWYRTGLVTLQQDSSLVTGTGTDFSTFVKPGFGFLGPDGKLLEVASVASSTALQLVTPYAGASVAGSPYAILQTQSIIADLATQTAVLMNTFTQSRNDAVAAAASAQASAAIVGDAAAIPLAKAAAQASAAAAAASADSVAIYLADMATAVIRTQTLIVTNLP